ncbi:MAG: mannonate dehydratase [Acidobacteriota bacterium]|nr:mannonate dehydratase [Acidobacteriota bacterium]
MNRRQILSSTAAAAAFQILPSGTRRLHAATPTRASVRLGCQSGPTDDRRLQFFARHAVQSICGYPIDSQKQGFYSVDDLSRTKEICDKYKIGLECIAPPYLASSHIDHTERPAIMLGKSPERDRDIEQLQNMIRNCAKVGIPSIKYNMSMLGVLRTGRTPGRGRSTYSTWNLKEAKSSGKFTPETRAGRVTADIYWERITYFLDRVIPVANEFKVRMACHPHDPGVPPVEGFQGVDAVLGTPDGLKKFVSIRESAYHGLNFCQGTVSEMLQDPGKEIYDVIRYFGSRKKIFNVHFRNIRGHRDAFQETYPDEGDVDFVRAMMVYKEVGYPYLMMPDHVPVHPDDKGGDQAFAFAYGYIKALIQAVDHMA